MSSFGTVPLQHPSGSGKNPSGDPPSCLEKHDCEAGTVFTETTRELQNWIFNLPGPDSTQTLTQSIRIHQLKVVEVWFTLPDQATLPPGNTLILAMSSLQHSPLYFSETKIIYTPGGKLTTDPTQTAPTAMQQAIAVMTLGNVAPGDHVRWKNEAHAVLPFSGSSRGVHDVRFTLLRTDGTVYTDLSEENRVFVNMQVWGELTSR